MSKFTDFFTGTLHSKAAHWMVAIVAATAHVVVLFSVTFTPDTASWGIPLLVAAPGLLTIALIPGAWRKWYRWGALLFLTYAVYPELLALVLAVGEAWAIHQAWFVDRTFPLGKLFTAGIRKRPSLPVKPARLENPTFADARDILFKEHRTSKSAKATAQAAKSATVKASKTADKTPAGV